MIKCRRSFVRHFMIGYCLTHIELAVNVLFFNGCNRWHSFSHDVAFENGSVNECQTGCAESVWRCLRNKMCFINWRAMIVFRRCFSSG